MLEPHAQSVSQSKSPIRPLPGTTWGTIGDNLNKSAVVASKMNGSMVVPSKLQRLKDRVKRERSANAASNENRENSLYGRRKKTNELDQECQKLRESYAQHRKPSKRGFGTLRNSISGSSLLHKQNFKEDPFDEDNRSR